VTDLSRYQMEGGEDSSGLDASRHVFSIADVEMATPSSPKTIMLLSDLADASTAHGEEHLSRLEALVKMPSFTSLAGSLADGVSDGSNMATERPQSVMVSYSRRDIDFVKTLRQSFVDSGFEVTRQLFPNCVGMLLRQFS